MMNIVEYVKEYGSQSFEDMPFNEVDSLILCQLSYLKYDSFVEGLRHNSKSVMLCDIYNSPNYEELFKDYWYYENNKALIKNMVESERFGNLKLNFFESIYEEAEDLQFAAVTYILGDKSVFIAFRGTDATILGWKEDIKLAYNRPVRAQEMAVGYLNQVALSFLGKFRIGGHSKGGNLAVYAAMMCRQDVRDRIIDIYNNDGPGFRPEIIDANHMQEIKLRIHKFIPRESIVGIILNNDDNYSVVDSTGVGTFQHNIYTWKVEGHSLVRVSQQAEYRKNSGIALNEWIYTLSDEEIDAFLEVMYSTATASEAKDLFYILENPKSVVAAAREVYKDMPSEKKDMVEDIMKRLLELLQTQTKESVTGGLQKIGSELKEIYDGLLEISGELTHRK